MYELTLWLAFIIVTAVIVFCGRLLAKFGDIIAEKTGMGRTWIGLILIATVTSLPELITGISSVTFAGVPDIAVGDVLGSCVFNMLILTVLDGFYRQGPLSARAHYGHILSGSMGILLLSIVALSLFAGSWMVSIGWIGLYTVVFGILYFFAMRLIFTYEKREISEYIKEVAVELKYEAISRRTAVRNYSINAAIVIIAAVFLPKIGEGIAETSGLGQTFVGNVFIAISTSLPEVVVAVAAIKMDAMDLAIGNLFGSNIFNIFILAIDDIFFLQGPLLSYANINNIISAVSAIAMMTVAIIGMTYRARKKTLFLAWDSIGILTIYVVNLTLLYLMR